MAARKDPPKSLVDVEAHVLYVGVTMTGKTTLARLHARQLSRSRYDVVVYDPVGTETAGGGWPDDALVFDDEEKFWKHLEGLKIDPERPTFVFVDEAADLFDHSRTDNHWAPRRIRHQGAYLRIIAQRPKMLHPSVRTQCAYAFAFRMSLEDMRILCGDFGHGPELYNVTLDTGDFLVLQSGSAEHDSANVFDLV